MICLKFLNYFVLYTPGQKLHCSGIVGVGLDRLYPDVLPELCNGGVLLFSGQAIVHGGTSGELAIALQLDHFSHLIVTGLKKGQGRVVHRSHDNNWLEVLDAVNYSELVPLGHSVKITKSCHILADVTQVYEGCLHSGKYRNTAERN